MSDNREANKLYDSASLLNLNQEDNNSARKDLSEVLSEESKSGPKVDVSENKQ